MVELDKPSYHHENLKEELIEAGIRIVAEEGADALSLRRLASECGVSHTAPYRHFKNKEDILRALSDHARIAFYDRMKETLDDIPEATPHVRLVELGKCYVQFMLENPSYFKFLFFRDTTGLVTDGGPECGSEESKDPRDLFKETAIEYLNSIQADPTDYEYDIVTMWGIVHGLSLMLTNHNWRPREPYTDAVGKILMEKLKFE